MTANRKTTAEKKVAQAENSPGFLEKLTAFAAAMESDPYEGIYAELRALRADVLTLAEEVARLKQK